MARGKGGLTDKAAQDLKRVSRRQGYFKGDRQNLDAEDDGVIQEKVVIQYDHVTLLIHPVLAEWLRRRKYWDRIPITDSIEQAIMLLKAEAPKGYEAIPHKPPRGKV